MSDDDLTGRAIASIGGRPLVLCGFMGVGKSSVGRRLSQILGRGFSDTDQLVVARLGRSIAELFASGDEQLFRRTEAAVTTEMIEALPPRVVALGGGALEEPATRRLVIKRALVVLLDQRWDDIAAALPALRRGRPLLSDRSDDDIRELFLRRQTNYSQAHIAVQVDRDGVDGAVAGVLRALARQRPDDEVARPAGEAIPGSFE